MTKLENKVRRKVNSIEIPQPLTRIIDIIGNKQKLPTDIRETQVLDGGIPLAGYAGHKPLPSPNPKIHLWCYEKHPSQFDSV